MSRQTTARDFRAKRKLMLGEAPSLEIVGEGGEFKHGTIEEAQETYSVKTFGKIIAISRQVQVNDDLGAFTDLPRRLGIAARSFESDQVVAKIIANPAMSDGVAVFHAADHKNQKVVGASLKADLSAARLAMRKRPFASRS